MYQDSLYQRPMPINAGQNSGIDPYVDQFRGISDQCHDFDQHWSALGILRESWVYVTIYAFVLVFMSMYYDWHSAFKSAEYTIALFFSTLLEYMYDHCRHVLLNPDHREKTDLPVYSCLTLQIRQSWLKFKATIESEPQTN